MTRASSAPSLGIEFNNFLYAPIGQVRNGMPLSVLSALARSDLDPWQEAANLASLPGKIAIGKLASLIAELPEEQSVHLDPETIAARLIALLPRQGRSEILLPRTRVGNGTAANSPSAARVVVINVIFIAFLLGTQWLVASRQTPA